MKRQREIALIEYIQFLESKGFKFDEGFYGFVHFGKGYTNASDYVVILAIEWTLKIKLTFDGAFFMAILELFVSENVETRKQAERVVEHFLVQMNGND
ncbi:DUF6123 family protein [Bacillus kexueae]|uniref:DUF6123 family protein n=1 Tax=Aeribacillus kexueae TaxID=2078952 RepID=UPI001FAFF351|nr:DUF6123 family protein [Bacillus kexueae]